jgi:hypothetical protein
MPTKTDRITTRERSELRSIVRHQMKVLRAEVSQREAEMLAEVGSRLVERYRDEDSKADGLRSEIRAIQAAANKQLAEVVVRHEKLFNSGKWSRLGEFSAPNAYRRHEDRDALRRALEAGVKAHAKTARLTLERQEADLLKNLALDALETAAARAFLDSLPTAAELMPLREIEAKVAAQTFDTVR